MIRFSEILNKAARLFGDIAWFLALHAFSIMILFIILDFIFGFYIFQKYVFTAERVQPNSQANIIKFDEKSYQQVLNKLQEKIVDK